MSTRHLVDPELLDLLDLFPTVELSRAALPALRSAERELPVGPPPGPAVVEAVDLQRRRIPGPEGGQELEIAVYAPCEEAAPRPCIFHIHGGGFVGGCSEILEPLHRPLAMELDCVLTSVDYRLAPETPFPGGIEDCYAALGWVFRNAGELGIDPNRIGVMGESAGGGLAAALALLARDRGEYALTFQHLIYPMLDDRTCVTETPNPVTGEFIWTRHNNHFGWSALLGADPGAPDVSPYAAPARATDLAGLPATFISTPTLDLFFDEDIDYASRLARAGVFVELHVYPGGYHGFDLHPTAQLAQQARRDSVAALKRNLRRTTA
jgi:triacylglycerol lipase